MNTTLNRGFFHNFFSLLVHNAGKSLIVGKQRDFWVKFIELGRMGRIWCCLCVLAAMPSVATVHDVRTSRAARFPALAQHSFQVRLPPHGNLQETRMALRGGQEGDEPFGWAQGEGCDVDDWKDLAQQVAPLNLRPNV